MTESTDRDAQSPGGEATLDPRSQGEAAVAGDQPTEQLEGLREQLAEAQRSAAATQDKHLRALAEMENYKKRLERTYADLARGKKKDLLVKLLGVKDNLERALQYGEDTAGNGESIVEGVRLTEYQLDQLLQQEGVQRIDALGQPFDPRLAEAIQSVDDPAVPNHTVVQVVRPGYIYQDQDDVLRPAQVIVSVHAGDA